MSEILFDISTNEILEQKFNQIKTINNEGFSKAALSFSISSSSNSGGNLGWIRESTLNKKLVTS